MEFTVHPNGDVTDEKGNKRNKYITKNGYVQVSIPVDGKFRKQLVHRLVAEKYIPNPFNKPCVNHIDGNKENNDVKNLEWCSYSENELHSHNVLGKKVSKEHLKKIHEIHKERASKTVMQRTLSGNYVASFKSMSEAMRKTGISQGNISECCNGKRKKAGGYIWNFAD